MKTDEIKVLQAIQKNTEMAMKAIDTISDKVYDDDFSMHLTKENLKYSQIHDKAVEHILRGKAQPYHSSYMSDVMLVSGIHANTLLDTSTSHIAELLIQGSNRGLTQLCRALNHNPDADKFCTEMAGELMDFEEKNISFMKKYL